MTKQPTSQVRFDAAAFQGMVWNKLAAVEMDEQALYNIGCRRMVADLQRIRDDAQLLATSP